MSELLDALPAPSLPIAGTIGKAALAPVKLVRNGVIVLVLIVAALIMADVQAMGAQKPADCAVIPGAFAVPVAKTHIPMIGWLTGVADDGTALRDVIAAAHPDTALTTVVAANPELHLTPMGDVPATSGGVACVNLGENTKAVTPKAPAKADAGKAVAP